MKKYFVAFLAVLAVPTLALAYYPELSCSGRGGAAVRARAISETSLKDLFVSDGNTEASYPNDIVDAKAVYHPRNPLNKNMIYFSQICEADGGDNCALLLPINWTTLRAKGIFRGVLQTQVNGPIELTCTLE